MSPESQRVALAELCPKSVLFRNGVPYWRNRYEYTESSGKVGLVAFDPLEDFNAIRAVVDAMDKNNSRAYAVLLGLAVSPNGWESWSDTLALATASEATHSEAILKACGKWVEAK